MIQIQDITLNCDESLHLELEELANVMADFLEQEVVPNGSRTELVYPEPVVRAIADAQGALSRAAYAVYLYYSRKNREELKNSSNPA